MKGFAVVVLATLAAVLLVEQCQAHNDGKPDNHMEEIEALLRQSHMPEFDQFPRFRRSAQEQQQGDGNGGNGGGRGGGKGGRGGRRGGQGGGRGGGQGGDQDGQEGN